MKLRQEFILGIVLFISFINFIFILEFFNGHGYLPPPFFHDKEDTFMDFYNVLYWSGQEGIYSVWESIYPPLNFLFLRVYQILFIGDVTHLSGGASLRGLDGYNIAPILILYAICLIIAVRISFKNCISIKKQIIILLILLLSPAFMFALERGNLIVLCIPVLSWLIFAKNQVYRAVALATLVNLKPYFAIFYFIQLINNKSRINNNKFIFLAPLFSLILLLSTGLMLGQEFYLLPLNLLGFVTNSSLLGPVEVLSFPSSIISFAYLRGAISGLDISPFFGYIIRMAVYASLLKIIILVIKKNISYEDLSILSILFITNYSVSTGGYGILYYIPILGLLYKKGEWLLMAIIGLGMNIGLWDWIPIYGYESANMGAYLSNGVLKVENYLSLGNIIRPLANFLILILFCKKYV